MFHDSGCAQGTKCADLAPAKTACIESNRSGGVAADVRDCAAAKLDVETVADTQVCRNQLLRVQDVADLLNVCTRTVERLVAKGEMAPPVKVGKASRWFLSDVETYVKRLLQTRSEQNNPSMDGGRS